jgi:hypothetical protein
MRYKVTIKEIGGEECIHYGTSPTWMLNKLIRDIEMTNIRHIESFSFEIVIPERDNPNGN